MNVLFTEKDEHVKHERKGGKKMKNCGACLKTVVLIAAVIAFVGLNNSVALAAAALQNSAHLDAQNTDLSDQTLTITSPPDVSWSRNQKIPGGDPEGATMVGCGLGLIVAEYRIATSKGILATVYYQDEYDITHFYLRKLGYDGTLEWDYPTGSTGFHQSAMWSVPAVRADGFIFYGDNTKIVRLQEIEQSPYIEADRTWEFNGKGNPIAFHLCGQYFNRVVTATTSGWVFLIVGDARRSTLLYDSSEQVFYAAKNTVGVSPDGEYAYITALDYPSYEINRLYAVDVNEATLPAEASMPRLDYDTGVQTESESSPLIMDAGGGDFYIYYDVWRQVDGVNDEDDYAVCALHDTVAGTITEEWKTRLHGDAKASFSYGPVYYSGAWRDVMWTFVNGESTLKGLALESFSSFDPGDIVAELTVFGFFDYKILSAVIISRNMSGGSEKTLAIFNMQHKTDSSEPSNIVALELEIPSPVEKPKAAEWAYELPGQRSGSNLGQFIIPDGENTVIFGQKIGSVICLE